MKPILVLQHQSADGPAYLATWLARAGLAAQVHNAEAGEPPPTALDAYSALAILGGEMSANDPSPALRQEEGLFLQALRDGVPTLGHCLGGQLMARALGAQVATLPEPEIGWHRVQISPGVLAQTWLGPATEQTLFQWHYDGFDLPEGATGLAWSAGCAHQAFALGPHLAMQFHVELDAQKLGAWMVDTGQRYVHAAAAHASVQSCATMRIGSAANLAAQQALADRIYSRWLVCAAGR